MDIADILIHVHPELSASQREKIETEVGALTGVVSVHFSSGHPHELTVAYDPARITSQRILELVRQWDKAASLVGL
jgi:allophanate hydrolase subunit 1